MKRILVLEYSQSGDVTKVADAFVRPLQLPGVEVHRALIRPVVPYPYPWGNILRLFSVLPECFFGSSNDILPLSFQPEERFDLVILAYQVWFLTPSLPIQAFLRSDYARVLRDTPVITLCVSRSMWHSASQTMKKLLRAAGAIHLDNVVVTHPGPPLATFVSVPRALLFGKRDRFLGIFPPAELSQEELDRVEHLGGVIASRPDDLQPPSGSLLTGKGAVDVRRGYVVPELFGYLVFRTGARFVASMGTLGNFPRQLALCLFLFVLGVLILVGIPLSFVVVPLVYPVVRSSFNRYAKELAAPSG